jgi:hypothetical protein
LFSDFPPKTVWKCSSPSSVLIHWSDDASEQWSGLRGERKPRKTILPFDNYTGSPI